MRTRDWAECENEGDEPSTGSNRIGEERDGDIRTGEALGHDPGADDGRQ